MSAHARYSNYGGKYGRNGGQSQKPSVNCDRSVLTALPGGDNEQTVVADDIANASKRKHYENMPMQIYREFLSLKNCKFLAEKF